MRRAVVALGLALLALAPAAAYTDQPIRVFGSSGDGEGQFLHPRLRPSSSLTASDIGSPGVTVSGSAST